jgi:hypothetical protein
MKAAEENISAVANSPSMRATSVDNIVILLIRYGTDFQERYCPELIGLKYQVRLEHTTVFWPLSALERQRRIDLGG